MEQRHEQPGRLSTLPKTVISARTLAFERKIGKKFYEFNNTEYNEEYFDMDFYFKCCMI